MAQNVGPTLVLNIDATGTSEARPCKFDFSKDPLILANDTLTTTNLNLSQQFPSGQGILTFGTATLSGSVITAEVSITNGAPSNRYTACCRTQTAAGYTVEAFVPVVLEGPGFQTLGSPAPSVGGQSGTVTSTTGVVQSMTLSQGLVQAPVTTGPVSSAQMQATGITAGNQGDASHIPVFNIDAAGRAVSLTNTPMVVKDQGGQVFNVMADKYGAKGDGVTDDTAAIQSAINDALAVSGTVFFPPPSPGTTYVITSTLNITGSGVTPRTVRLFASPNRVNHAQLITYNGTSNSSVVALSGVQDCHFINIGITVASGLNNVVVWDYQFPANFGNTGSYNRHTRCNTYFPNSTNCVSLRLGQGPGGSSCFDLICEHCVVIDSTTNSGNIAVQIGGSQVYSPAFYDCSFNANGANILCGPIASSVTSALNNGDTVVHVADTLLFPSSGTISIGGNAAAYTAKSVQSGPGTLTLAAPWSAGTFNGNQISLSVGGQVYVGNCSFKFTGGTISGNGSSMGYDILILCAGYCTIADTQSQMNPGTPRRFLQTGVGSSSVAVHITIRSSTIKGYAPPTIDTTNGITPSVMWLHFNTTLDLDGVSINPNDGTAYSSSRYLISNSGGNGFGSIRLKNCDIFGTFPFINNAALGAGWPIDYNQAQLVSSGNSVQSALNNSPTLTRTITATTYTVTTGNDHNILCNAASNAITINLPSVAAVPAGWTYVVKKTDSTANAVTVTPNGTDKIDGAATFSLASQYKYLRIVNDGASWNNVGSN